MTDNIVTLDVRAEFRAGLSPCDKVHGAINNVAADQTLRLLVPFQPVPLFRMAERIGLVHEAKSHPNGDWEVLFSRDHNATTPSPAEASPAQQSCGCGCSETQSPALVTVDARGLPPPQPMVRILETLESLPAQSAVVAHTDRRPVHLYGFLEERGFVAESEEQADGSFITHIRRQ